MATGMEEPVMDLKGVRPPRTVGTIACDLFSDEQGKISSARVLLTTWLGVIAVAAWTSPEEPFWPVAGSIALGLLGWAAGPRIASYLFPQLGEAARAAAEAVRNRKSKSSSDDFS